MVKVTKAENNMHVSTNKQSGIAAIFVVVFFTLLISIIVLSFVAIVNQDIRQATNADLSSSAYDSAQAGVEDAKRALEQYQKECIQTSPPALDCATKYTNPTTGALSGVSCSSFQEKLSGDLGLKVDPTSKEVKVATNTNDDALDQAYTCLKVNLYPIDYKRSLDNGQTILVPLKAVGGVDTNSIKLSWFDKSQGNPPSIPNIPASGSFILPTGKPPTGEWGSTKPPVIRAQVIAVIKSSINMNDIDDNSRAVFLYPNTHLSAVDTVDIKFYDISRTQPKTSPVAVKCSDASAIYACSIKITNIAPSSGSYDYYLRLTAIYNGANLQIQMLGGPDGNEVPLKFDGVQPEIDSTGRVNNVFRRVVSRISFDSDNSGIDVTQGICKNFQLADGSTYYKADCSGLSDLVD